MLPQKLFKIKQRSDEDTDTARSAAGHRRAGERLEAVDGVEWACQQGDDADIRPVLTWVAAQCQLWRRNVKRGWKEPATGETQWQVVVPKALWETVLQTVHGAPGSGHSGVAKTLCRFRQGIYWGQHQRDVEDFFHRCDSCTARKGPTERLHAQLQQFPVGCPMERVRIDVLGPFPRTDKGKRYVLTAMDYFTKWPEAYSLPDQEAETIVDTLVKVMFQQVRGARGHTH